jgi:hypothetical protein
MKELSNIWKNDWGFIWMLLVSILALISTQTTGGLLHESNLLIRISFFIVTLITIHFSTLRKWGKFAGYLISSILMLTALALISNTNSKLLLLFSSFSTLYMVFILALVIIQIFEGGTITIYKVFGGIACYILLGLLWGSIYLTIHILDPSAFQYAGGNIQTVDAVKQLSYFSFVTLTTIGYGDITALSATSRLFVMLEGLTGQLFPAIFIAKLVALQIEHARK